MSTPMGITSMSEPPVYEQMLKYLREHTLTFPPPPIRVLSAAPTEPQCCCVYALDSRCDGRADGEDGLCHTCRNQRHGLNDFLMARHAKTGALLGDEWRKLERRR